MYIYIYIRNIDVLNLKLQIFIVDKHNKNLQKVIVKYG